MTFTNLKCLVIFCGMSLKKVNYLFSQNAIEVVKSWIPRANQWYTNNRQWLLMRVDQQLMTNNNLPKTDTAPEDRRCPKSIVWDAKKKLHWPLVEPPPSMATAPCQKKDLQILKSSHHLTLGIHSYSPTSQIMIGMFNHLRNAYPYWELTYPIKSHIFEDDFPFPKVGYVSSLEGSLWVPWNHSQEVIRSL